MAGIRSRQPEKLRADAGTGTLAPRTKRSTQEPWPVLPGPLAGRLFTWGMAGRSRRRISTRLRRQTLGAEHADVAASLHHRAGWAYQKGDFAGSETLYREALALRRKLPGAEHPDIALSPANLASALQDIGHSRAEHFSCFGRQRPADRPEPLHDSQSKESFRDRQFALLFSHG